jgi:serine/threonine protein kinase
MPPKGKPSPVKKPAHPSKKTTKVAPMKKKTAKRPAKKAVGVIGFLKKWKLWRGGSMLGQGQFGCVFNKEDFGDQPGLEYIKFDSSEDVNDTAVVVKVFGNVESYKEELDGCRSVLAVGKNNSVVPKYYGYSEQVTMPAGGSCRFPEANGAIVMEKLTKNLGDVIKKNEKIPFDKIKAFVDGVKDYNSAGVVHCDIKPDNIMFAEDGRMVLVDWGFAKQIKDLLPSSNFGCTPHYMSPIICVNSDSANGMRIFKRMTVNNVNRKDMYSGYKTWFDGLLRETTAANFDGYLEDLGAKLRDFVTNFDQNQPEKNTMYYSFVDRYSLALVLVDLMFAETVSLSDELMAVIKELLNLDEVFSEHSEQNLLSTEESLDEVKKMFEMYGLA